mmetsp:Transcript_29291/g.98719  ORF Transcript_29291/g.98719 Transcript_29291/m.98719 type:complete len:260 (+) Transcript_29291:869-1648(+)
MSSESRVPSSNRRSALASAERSTASARTFVAARIVAARGSLVMSPRSPKYDPSSRAFVSVPYAVRIAFGEKPGMCAPSERPLLSSKTSHSPETRTKKRRPISPSEMRMSPGAYSAMRAPETMASSCAALSLASSGTRAMTSRENARSSASCDARSSSTFCRIAPSSAVAESDTTSSAAATSSGFRRRRLRSSVRNSSCGFSSPPSVAGGGALTSAGFDSMPSAASTSWGRKPFHFSSISRRSSILRGPHGKDSTRWPRA